MDPPEKECWERGNGYANTCQSICHAENQIDFSTATIKCVSLTVDLHIRQLRPAETKPVNYNKSPPAKYIALYTESTPCSQSAPTAT